MLYHTFPGAVDDKRFVEVRISYPTDNNTAFALSAYSYCYHRLHFRVAYDLINVCILHSRLTQLLCLSMIRSVCLHVHLAATGLGHDLLFCASLLKLLQNNCESLGTDWSFAGVQIQAAMKERLLSLDTTEPIAYRKQNYGDYTMPDLELKPGLEQQGETGFNMHVIKS